MGWEGPRLTFETLARRTNRSGPVRSAVEAGYGRAARFVVPPHLPDVVQVASLASANRLGCSGKTPFFQIML